jgi:DNA-binding phage protein
MVPVTFRTQVTAEHDADGAGRHLASLRRSSGMSKVAERAVLGGEALDVAVPAHPTVPGAGTPMGLG